MATDDDDEAMRVIRATMAMTMTKMTTIRAPNRLAFATEDGNRKPLLLRLLLLLLLLLLMLLMLMLMLMLMPMPIPMPMPMLVLSLLLWHAHYFLFVAITYAGSGFRHQS